MPLNEALTIAVEISVLQKRVTDINAELVEINARRTALSTERDSVQAQIVAKRTAFRTAAQDA